MNFDFQTLPSVRLLTCIHKMYKQIYYVTTISSCHRISSISVYKTHASYIYIQPHSAWMNPSVSTVNFPIKYGFLKTFHPSLAHRRVLHKPPKRHNFSCKHSHIYIIVSWAADCIASSRFVSIDILMAERVLKLLGVCKEHRQMHLYIYIVKPLIRRMPSRRR